MRWRDSGLEHVPSIEQPRDARLIAIALPIPRDAPVMTATLPCRSCSRRRSPVDAEFEAIGVEVSR